MGFIRIRKLEGCKTYPELDGDGEEVASSLLARDEALATGMGPAMELAYQHIDDLVIA